MHQKANLHQKLANRVRTLSDSKNYFTTHVPGSILTEIENQDDNNCFKCYAKTTTKIEISHLENNDVNPLTEEDVILWNEENSLVAFNRTHFKVVRYMASEEKKDKKDDPLAYHHEPRKVYYLFEQSSVASGIVDDAEGKASWFGSGGLLSFRIDNSGLDQADLMGVVFGKNMFILETGLKADDDKNTIMELKIRTKKLLKIKAEKIKHIIGKNNNVVILSKDHNIRSFVLENEKLIFLRKLNQSFFFPNFKLSRKKSNFKIVDIEFTESLKSTKKMKKNFEYCPKKSNKKNCFSINNNFVSFLFVEPFNSKDKWIIHFSLKQLVSRNKVTGHEMQYPKNEFVIKNLLFKNLKMEVTQEQEKTHLRVANKAFLVSNKGKPKLVYSRWKYNFIFLVFAMEDRLKLMMFTFKKNIGVEHNAQNLKPKHIIFISHYIQLKDSLELLPGKSTKTIFFQKN